MTQKTDLNISPYYDDFDPAKNYHKVLFKPGFPVQARELTTLQSMLQNQIKDFGEHMFKEGSIVIPGAPTLDVEYDAVKLQATQFSIDISLYTSELIGKTLIGQTSGVSATVVNVVLPNGGTVEDTTIYVKYLNASVFDFETSTFVDGEGLYSDTNITYGNTTINSGTIVATLITVDALAVGSAAHVDEGIYFVRGSFVNVSKQTIILDHYTNNPSYRIGLQVNEEIISAKDDASLYDNAKGFTNYAAPGADRLKISLVLTKKEVSDTDGTNFIEILRTDEGDIQKIQEDSQYNRIRDWIADRTFDESGNYAVDMFDITVDDSLNNRLGNGGIYFPGQKTEEGNTPSKDLLCYRVSSGEAYVRGYDVRTDGTSIIDVEKPRDTQKVERHSVPFEMGHLIKLNNLKGQPALRKEVELCSNIAGNSAVDGSAPLTPASLARWPGIIGRARLYEINTADTVYSNEKSEWDCYLYDINFFEYITLNATVTTAQVPISTQVKGASSNAVGYVYTAPGGGSYHLILSDVRGTFQVGESLIFNGVQSPQVSIQYVDIWSFADVKSVYQLLQSGYPSPFQADVVLGEIGIPNIDVASLSDNVLYGGGTQFVGIKTGDIVSYQAGFSTAVYNRVNSISEDGLSITLAGNAGIDTSVPGVYNATNLSGFTTAPFSVSKRIGAINQSGSLTASLPEYNISSVDLSNSDLVISAQVTGETESSNTISIGIGQVTDGRGTALASPDTFESFKADRFAVFQSVPRPPASSAVATIRSNQVTGSTTLEITGVPQVGNSETVVNVTAKKNSIVSKIKNLSKSNILDVIYSRDSRSGIGQSTSLYDGLTYTNSAYGLRVQDEEISLNVPDAIRVIAVYESINNDQPVLDIAEFGATAVVETNAIIGENIIGESSNAVARVVTNNGTTPASGNTNKLGIVYLNGNTFEVGENVTFEESNIKTLVVSVSNGTYNNISKSFVLDGGQHSEYCDYSRLLRKESVAIPSRRLMVIFDKYTVPTNDTGDVFTALSYPESSYNNLIPTIGSQRATDVLDFRPRVPNWVSSASTESPFYWTSRTGISNDQSPKWIVAPKEISIVGYEYYLGRVDRLYLDKNGRLQLSKGVSADSPVPPDNINGAMELATIALPPYVYKPNDVVITHTDNKRYTMRDIGVLEERIGNLEEVTTLSFLEVNTEAIRVTDSQGRDRFKSGFFVDNFQGNDNVDYSQGSKITVDTENGLIRPVISRNSLDSYLEPLTAVTDQDYDSSIDYELLDPNVQKTGKLITLKYNEVGWIEQDKATRVVNVNEFHVMAYEGNIQLTPSSDSWERTIRLDDTISETSENRGNLWAPAGTKLVTKMWNFEKGEFPYKDRWNNPYTFRTQGKHVPVAVPMANGKVVDWRLVPHLWPAQWNLRWGLPAGGISIRESLRRFGGFGLMNGMELIDTTHVEVTSRDVIVDTGDEEFMRSRNTAFKARGLKPNIQHYQWIDGESGVDFIPKLLEIATDSSLGTSGSDGVFQVGETVRGYNLRGERTMSFRVNQSNHKIGKFNDPSEVYGANPYNTTENVQSTYTSTSKTLNIGIVALAREAQGQWNGFVKKGFKLVGQTSGAVAYVKDLRLISDNVGDLFGSYFIRDPHRSPRPSVVLRTGRSDYTLNSSNTEARPATGSKTSSYAATQFETRGTFVLRQKNIRRNTVVTLERRRRRHTDPLAQSFVVAAPIEAPDPNEVMPDDQHGAFLTSADVWFYKKDTGNAPLTAEIRTVELGVPTMNVLGPSVTLTPDQINVSDDASVATNIKFPEPIYLEPGNSYALVLISPASNKYECWCARFGETTVKPQQYPESQPETYSVQWAMGSLFVSQNGATWTARQTDDLKMKLYKAEFIPSEGTVYFTNPTLDSSNGFSPTLNNNPIITYPKNGQIEVSNLGAYEHVLTPGTEIRGETNTAASARVDGFGAPVKDAEQSLTFAGLAVTTSYSGDDGGEGYKADAGVTIETQALSGKGSGLTLKITNVDASHINEITGITTVSFGSGYQVGDIVGLVTSTCPGAQGTGAQFTVTSIGTTATMFLTRIQGTDDSFANTKKINYYNSSGALVTAHVPALGPNLPTYSANLVTAAFPNNGNTFRVDHFNHNMHTSGNEVIISDVHGSSGSTPLLSELSRTETGSINVGTANTTNFWAFEGLPVSGNNKGYVRIEDEIISYEAANADGTLTGLARGVDSTIATLHGTNTFVEKYELDGVSLCRINKTHNLQAEGIGLNHYHISFDRGETTTTKDRSADDISSTPKTAQLSFTEEAFVGGERVIATENIMFDSIWPNYDISTPGGVTEASASVRTVTGTSIDGTETSFLDLGYQPVQLNELNEFQTPRLVCSAVNEAAKLTTLPRNKSFTTAIKFATTNKNVSPAINLDVAGTVFRCNLLDNPISDYTTDPRVNQAHWDPNAAIYVSNSIRLDNPADSIKVIFDAIRGPDSTIRVAYSTRQNEWEGEDVYLLFPGYNNIDSSGRVVSDIKHDGLPDTNVLSSPAYQSYEYSVDDLAQFNAFRIKIIMTGTNQAQAPRIRNLRAIATL
mgnify:CR=1 FL=1